MFSESHAATPVEGRMKVIHPLLSTDPAARVQVVEQSDDEVTFRAQLRVFTGELVQLRVANRIVTGEVSHCSPWEAEHEIRIRVKEILCCA